MNQISIEQVEQVGRENRQDINAQSLRLISALLAVISLFWWWWFLSLDSPPFWGTVLAAILVVLFTIAYFLANNSLRLAGAIAFFACSVGLLLVCVIMPQWPVEALFVLPWLVATAACGLKTGLVSGLLFVVVAVYAIPQAGQRHIVLWETTILCIGGGLLLLPRENILDWSWWRSAEATRLAEQLRDRQGELNKALGQLHLAYQLLERTNRELALAHREAEDARRLKEEFAANVSHELRTPLNIILGFAEIMHRSPRTYGLAQWPTMLTRDIAEIWRSAKYISELVDDILELARVDALRMPVKRELTDIRRVLEETTLLAERLVEKKSVTMLLRLEESLPLVYVDKTRIRQVLLNLLSNAVRFTDQGTIQVEAVRRDEEILVTVSDTGIGIPPHEIDSIFSEFHRGEAQEGRGGKGLGLAIARRFVQMHGGRIWAESEVGIGSKFHFTLPVMEKQVSRLKGNLSASVPRAPANKILTLDDSNNSMLPAFLARHLEGFAVMESHNLEEATALLEQHHPCAVVVSASSDDPAMESNRVAEVVPPGVPVLGVSLPQTALPEDNNYFDAIVSKPVPPQKLAALIERFAKSGSVLVIDDDRGFVQLVRRVLSAEHPEIDVRWAYDGAEALGKLKSSPVDLILVDMVMEPMSGNAFADSVRSDPYLCRTPLVAITGATSLSDREKVESIHLVKKRGLKDVEVLAVIRSVLAAVKSEYVTSGPIF